MYPIGSTWYTAGLRLKLGELQAVHTLNLPNKDRLLPHFLMLPRAAKDVEKKRPLIGEELVTVPAERLAKHWSSRPYLLDFRYIKFDEDREIDASKTQMLLANATRFGTKPIPVFDLHTKSNRLDKIFEHSRNTSSGVAMRLTLDDMDSTNFETLRTETSELLKRFDAKPHECIAILDFSEADMTEREPLATFLVESVHRLQEIGSWARIIFEATNYPVGKNPCPDNSKISIARAEWDVWIIARTKESSLSSLATFGDFGADSAHIRESGGGGKGAIPHFRYAKSNEWLVSRGNKEYSTIRGVAQSIVHSGSFMGEKYSAGDEFIADCASGLGGTGNPTDWRRVNMNHHLTLATNMIGNVNGSPIAEPQTRRRAQQAELFSTAMLPVAANT